LLAQSIILGLSKLPIGTPLVKLIYDIGNGIPNDKKSRATNGGPSGGCVPMQHLNVASRL
jgi:NADH-quinone oxidoreductase subunit F